MTAAASTRVAPVAATAPRKWAALAIYPLPGVPIAAMLYAENIGPRLAIGWTMGTVVSALGVWLSLQLDLPTGATIVCTFGGVLLLMAAVRPLIRRTA